MSNTHELMTQLLDKIEDRRNATTHGEWTLRNITVYRNRYHNDCISANLNIYPHPPKRITPEDVLANATFITHAQKDILVLLQLVKTQSKIIKTLASLSVTQTESGWWLGATDDDGDPSYFPTKGEAVQSWLDKLYDNAEVE